MNDESYTIEESLKALEINYDDITQVTDGSYGYLLLLTSNLDEDGEKKLLKLEFFKIFDDLWCKEGENLQDIPKLRIIELIENISGNNSEQRKTLFQERIKELWESLVLKFCRIKEETKSNDEKQITEQDIETVCKFKDFVCSDKDQIKVFISDLYEFLKHFTDNKKFRKSREISNALTQLKRYRYLRHYYVHDPKKINKDTLSQVKSFFISTINKQTPCAPYDFWKIQEKILEDCNNVLENIINASGEGEDD